MIECGGEVIARHTLREERYQDVPKDQLSGITFLCDSSDVA
jgi:hypothetical protein